MEYPWSLTWKGRSCESQLLELTHDLLNGLHDGKQTDLIVMDFAKAFAKAFDKVCHEKLLTTLHHYSVDPTTIHWIRGLLSNRSQSVVIEGAQLPLLPVTSGVPQGTVLGPALFLCYINSMPEGISSSIRLFVDDTVVYRHFNSAADHTILQQDLHKLARWEDEYSMTFHPEECNVLRVTWSRSPSIFNYLHGTNLKSTESTKYLGVTLTKDLTWGKHIDIIMAKANQQLAFVRRNIILCDHTYSMQRLSGTRTSPNRNTYLRWYNEELRDGSPTDIIIHQVCQTCSTH